jgi:hypothetical protein
MALIDNLQKILPKEVTRKEFLGILGLAVGSVLGFGHVIKLLSGKSVSSRPSIATAKSNSYGGTKRVG